MNLLIDTTPATINRTAIYYIVMDVCSYMRKRHRCRFQLFDQIVSPDLLALDSAVPSTEGLNLIGEAFLNYVYGRASSQSMTGFAGDLFPKRNPSELLLLFDPLYALHHELDDASVVFVLDLTTHTMPQWHNSSVCVAYAQAFSQLRRSRCKIVSISQSTTLDLRCNFGIQADRIVTLPLYLRSIKPINGQASSSLMDNIYRQFRPYFLFVGSLEERKNLTGLIEAFGLSRLADEGYSLLIAGRDGHGAETIHSAASGAARVHLLGGVDDQKLDALYRGCDAFVYPSYWEGFGLPLLEAMARGIPCLSTETGASPELGGDAVIYADPCNTASIATALRRLAALSSTEREFHSRRGIERANEYTFARFITGLERVLSSVNEIPVLRTVHSLRKSKMSMARLRAQAIASDMLLPSLPRLKLVHEMRLPDAFSVGYAYLVQQSARLAFANFLQQRRPLSIRTFLPFLWDYFRNSLRLRTAILLSDALIREKQLLEISSRSHRNDQ